MNQLQKMFNHPEFGELQVITEGDKDLFNLNQVAYALGYTKSNGKGGIYLRHERIEKILENLDITVSVRGGHRYIDESGLYDFVFEAGTESSRKYRKWVTSDVLPTIRKNGAYMTPNTLEQAIANPDFTIGLLTNLKEEQNKRHEAEKVIEIQRPKVVYADAVTVSEDTVLVKDLSIVLKQKGIDIGEVRLFKWMRENGYLCKQKGEMWNMPTQRSLDLGVFVVKHGLRTGSLGEMKKTRTPKITGKGQIYFVNKFIGNEQLLNVK